MPIKIKDSKKGSFTRAASSHGKSVKEFEKQVLANPDNYSPAMRKKAQFSANARKWNKGQNGISLPTNQQLADNEMFRNFQQGQNNLSVDTFEGQYSDAFPVQPIQANSYNQNTSLYNNVPPPTQNQPYDGRYGDMALSGLLAVDALIPNRRQPSQVIRPLNSYNPSPYGTGSRSIAQNGLAIGPKFNRNTLPLSYQEQQDQYTTNNQILSNDPNKNFRGNQNYLNPQQEYFYRALSNTSGNISDVYRGFNEELVGYGSDVSQTVQTGSPFTGTYLLNNEDKQLLQDEYLTYSQKFKGNKRNYFENLRSRGASNPRLANLIDPASFALGQEFEFGGKISNSGYRSNSPDRWEPSLTIPASYISMRNVDHPVIGIDNTGNQQYMLPGEDYEFPGDYVTEIPVRKMGGKICKSGGKLPYKEGDTYDLTDNEIRTLVANGYEIKIH